MGSKQGLVSAGSGIIDHPLTTDGAYIGEVGPRWISDRKVPIQDSAACRSPDIFLSSEGECHELLNEVATWTMLGWMQGMEGEDSL